MIRNMFWKPIHLSAVVVGVAALAVSAQDYEITRSTIDGGGAMHSTGGAFELSGTIGQPDAGALAGGDFELTGGFWFALAPTDCNDDGGVDLATGVKVLSRVNLAGRTVNVCMTVYNHCLFHCYTVFYRLLWCRKYSILHLGL